MSNTLYPNHFIASRENISAVQQLTLMMEYKRLLNQGHKPLSFMDIGFRIYSQHEEDGILLFIFSLIGIINKQCVEICAGNGKECNTTNLIINHRWIALLCDGKKQNIKVAKRFFQSCLDTKYWPPKIAHHWITRGNINQIISDNGFSGEIDLLSLDIDGNDYWIWKEMDCISPRVVVLEYNHLWGPDRAVTVPYADDFKAGFTKYGSDYAGASLMAFVKLAKEKGYRLVGTNAISTNAFFVRTDIECSWLPEIDTHSCFDHPRAKFGMTQRLPGIKDKPWVEV